MSDITVTRRFGEGFAYFWWRCLSFHSTEGFDKWDLELWENGTR